MSLSEEIILAVMSLNLILILVRCFGIREGKVVRRWQYQVGKSMTIGSRQVQGDCCGISRSSQGLLAVLADGMGGGYGGKIAGKIAVDAISEIFAASDSLENPAYFFKRAFLAANREILKVLDEGRGGASVASALLQEGRLYYALAGNVKVAVFRNSHLVQVSSGHTLGALAEEQFQRGSLAREDAEGLLESRRLYNHLGKDGFQDIELIEVPVALRSKDIVAVMSDGIFEGITWRELEECLARNRTCQEKAAEIIELINASSKEEKDNASIILIQQP